MPSPTSFARHASSPPSITCSSSACGNRVMQDMAETFATVDAIVGPRRGPLSVIGNMTGHPCVVLPMAFASPTEPVAAVVHAGLFDEATALDVALVLERAAGLGGRRPPELSHPVH